MRRTLKMITGGVLAGSLLLPLAAQAEDAQNRGGDQDIQKKISDLSKQLDDLKREVGVVKKKSLGTWLSIGGDYMFRYDYLYAKSPSFFAFQPGFSPAVGTTPAGAVPIVSRQPSSSVSNDALMTHRFGLNLNAKPMQDITFGARLLMYKAFGNQSDSVLQSGNTAYSFDRAGLFDGTIGHLPGSSFLDVDRVYVDWQNIGGQPVWFSVGRRPSTDGIPLHLKNDQQRPGVGGIPALLVNYAFDGMTLGYAPEINALPGIYTKLCYGRGFSTPLSDSRNSNNSLKDTDMIGIQLSPYNTDALQVLFQYNRAFNIFDAPTMETGPFASIMNHPRTNLGDIDWYGLNLLGEIKHVGPGTLNWFVQGALDNTHPNANTLSLYNPYDPSGSSSINTGAGLLWTGTPKTTTGWAAYAGVRYDLPSATKIGLEFNHGSKNWITFAPAEDDMWTSKVGTRGNVYEAYVIQELPLRPISSYFSKAFFKVGYQYYDFDYTGSNSWIGAPVSMSSLDNPMNAQMTAPLSSAQDLYVTFEVNF